jgi:hypothetical protein
MTTIMRTIMATATITIMIAIITTAMPTITSAAEAETAWTGSRTRSF